MTLTAPFSPSLDAGGKTPRPSWPEGTLTSLVQIDAFDTLVDACPSLPFHPPLVSPRPTRRADPNNTCAPDPVARLLPSRADTKTLPDQALAAHPATPFPHLASASRTLNLCVLRALLLLSPRSALTPPPRSPHRAAPPRQVERAVPPGSRQSPTRRNPRRRRRARPLRAGRPGRRPRRRRRRRPGRGGRPGGRGRRRRRRPRRAQVWKEPDGRDGALSLLLRPILLAFRCAARPGSDRRAGRPERRLSTDADLPCLLSPRPPRTRQEFILVDAAKQPVLVVRALTTPFHAQDWLEFSVSGPCPSPLLPSLTVTRASTTDPTTCDTCDHGRTQDRYNPKNKASWLWSRQWGGTKRLGIAHFVLTDYIVRPHRVASLVSRVPLPRRITLTSPRRPARTEPPEPNRPPELGLRRLLPRPGDRGRLARPVGPGGQPDDGSRRAYVLGPVGARPPGRVRRCPSLLPPAPSAQSRPRVRKR